MTIDRMLPGLDGLALIRRLREAGVATPALILSALGEIDDRVRGLRAGGDDYLVKPFAFAELLARVEALARRSATVVKETVLRVDQLELDLVEFEIVDAQYCFRSEEHTSELQSHLNLVCRLLLEKKKKV